VYRSTNPLVTDLHMSFGSVQARRFRGPPQRRFRIAPRLRFDQAIQYTHQFGIGDFSFLATPSWRPNSTRRSACGILSELGHATPNRRL